MAMTRKKLEEKGLVNCNAVLATYGIPINCTYIDIDSKTFENRFYRVPQEALIYTKDLFLAFLSEAKLLADSEDTTNVFVFPFKSPTLESGAKVTKKWWCKVTAYKSDGADCLLFSEIAKEEAKRVLKGGK